MWNICGWIWRLSASALVSEWPKTTAASHSLLLLCYSLWNVLLCSYPRTSSISSFAFKMHHTTVTNIFTHNVRTNLFTTFLERRLKQDSYLVEQGEKINLVLQYLCEQQRRWGETYFILEIVCGFVCCHPCLLGLDTMGQHPSKALLLLSLQEMASRGHGEGRSAPHKHRGHGKCELSSQMT